MSTWLFITSSRVSWTPSLTPGPTPSAHTQNGRTLSPAPRCRPGAPRPAAVPAGTSTTPIRRSFSSNAKVTSSFIALRRQARYAMFPPQALLPRYFLGGQYRRFKSVAAVLLAELHRLGSPASGELDTDRVAVSPPGELVVRDDSIELFDQGLHVIARAPVSPLTRPASACAGAAWRRRPCARRAPPVLQPGSSRDGRGDPSRQRCHPSWRWPPGARTP